MSKIQGKKRDVLGEFLCMIADTIINKKLNSVVTELFIRGKKLNFTCFYQAIML